MENHTARAEFDLSATTMTARFCKGDRRLRVSNVATEHVHVLSDLQPRICHRLGGWDDVDDHT